MDTPPVLFIVFNRPETARRVFGEIRAARPGRLFIAADGPREGREGEAQRCEESRALIKEIDWPCEVHTLFRDSNLGCKRAVSSAIQWFFENNEVGIILEDDCLPHPSFFPFAADMLDKYRDEEKARMVAGLCMLPPSRMDPRSCFFSRYFPIWGWATWRRAWKDYDIEMREWPEFAASGRLERMIGDPRYRAMLRMGFDGTYRGKIDTWDYQWVLSSYLHDGLCLTPGANLISNIGMVGAHMSGKRNSMLNMPTRGLMVGELERPPIVEADRERDALMFERIVSSTAYPAPLVPIMRAANTVLNRVNPERWRRREIV